MISAPTSLEAAVANQERLQKLSSFNRTDAGNAEAFAFLHGQRFRFDHSRRMWLVWNARYWASDDTGEADRAAVHVARERLKAGMLIEDPDDKKKVVAWALHSESSYGRKA